MAITIKKIELWNVVIDNQPGALAAVLEPLAAAGADLELVMGTAIPGADRQASVGVFPVKGRKVIAAAQTAGLAPAAAMPSLLVGGDNRPGLGGRMSEAIAQAGINIGMTVAQVVGTQFSALFAFASEEDANRAATLLRKVGAAEKVPAAKKTTTVTKQAAATKAAAPRRSR